MPKATWTLIIAGIAVLIAFLTFHQSFADRFVTKEQYRIDQCRNDADHKEIKDKLDTLLFRIPEKK